MTNDRLLDRLRRVGSLRVEDDAKITAGAATDFGGLTHGRVKAVVCPATVDALATLVTIARDESLVLVPRSLGLSQSGQSVPVDGVSVDMSSFSGIEVRADRGVARCGSGVTWRQLLAETMKVGWAPEVMPLNLDLSIGGTLSAGGIGSTSHRYGMALSSVESMMVVTGAGEQVETNARVRPEVFESVLGGWDNLDSSARLSCVSGGCSLASGPGSYCMTISQRCLLTNAC